MRFDSVLDDVLGTRAARALLRVLVRTAGGEYTGRDLARLVRMDNKSCSAALEKLARHGVVQARTVGRARAYTLNHEHLLTDKVLRSLFATERGLLETLGAEINERLRKQGVDSTSIAIFGSVARRAETVESDVDLLVIAPRIPSETAQEEIVDALAAFGLQRYGNRLQLFFETPETLRRKQRQRDRLVLEILREARVIHGTESRELRRRG